MCRGEAPGREERVTYASTLSNHWRYEATREANLRTIADSETKALEGVAGTRDETVVSYRSSVDASAMVMVTDDLNLDPGAFPEQKRDVNSQQLDLRRTNSWLLTLSSGNISTPELAEVFAINAMAPFILASKLTPLLTAPRPSKRKLCCCILYDSVSSINFCC